MNAQEEADRIAETTVTRRSVWWAKFLLWGIMSVTLTAVAAIAWVVFTTPPPAVFHSVTMLTPAIQPRGEASASRGGGNVAMSAVLESTLDPECLVSTQYFIEYSDGSVSKVPGIRITTKGETKGALYEAAVPSRVPAGPAEFWVRDSYNCGIRARRAQTPRGQFVVLP